MTTLAVVTEYPTAARLPAITLRQPWASLTAKGKRHYETRHWAPRPEWVGRRIAIHASNTNALDKHWNSDEHLSADFCNAVEFALGDRNWRRHLPLGKVIATAQLIGAYRCGEPQIQNGKPARQILQVVRGSSDVDAIEPDPFGDFSYRRWAWQLTEVCEINPPVAARGHQTWFWWTA